MSSFLVGSFDDDIFYGADDDSLVRISFSNCNNNKMRMKQLAFCKQKQQNTSRTQHLKNTL